MSCTRFRWTRQLEALSRRLGLPVLMLEEWRQRGLAGTDAGRRERDDGPKDRRLAGAHRRIGGHPRPAGDHDGAIITEAPDVTWGADGG